MAIMEEENVIKFYNEGYNRLSSIKNILVQLIKFVCVLYKVLGDIGRGTLYRDGQSPLKVVLGLYNSFFLLSFYT